MTAMNWHRNDEYAASVVDIPEIIGSRKVSHSDVITTYAMQPASVLVFLA